MEYIPRSYAPAVVEFMLKTPRCNIWLDPGLGKTGISLCYLDLLWLAGSNKFPCLVVAPKRVARSVWSDEIDKFSRFHNLTIQKMIGDPETRLAALNTPADIYTINYENLPWLVDLCEDFWPFKIIISDESTALKGFRLRHGGKRAGALAKAAKYTARWINLTGSPSPNGLIDLWGQCWFIDMGQRLGTSFSDFKKRWFDEDKYAHSITPKSFAETQITELIADVTYSLRADEVFDLEPILHNPIYVELPPKARALYDQMENEMCIAFGDGEEVEAKTAADLSLKTLQIASGALYRRRS